MSEIENIAAGESSAVAEAEARVQGLRVQLESLKAENEEAQRSSADAIRIAELDSEAERLEREVEFERRKKAVAYQQAAKYAGVSEPPAAPSPAPSTPTAPSPAPASSTPAENGGGEGRLSNDETDKE